MQQYDVNINNLNSVLSAIPRKPGVYGFKDDAGMFLYIGQSIDLRRRLMEHRDRLEGFLMQFTANNVINVIFDENPIEYLDEIEQHMIGKYMPRFNADWNEAYYDPSVTMTVTVTLPFYVINNLQDMRYREGMSLDEAFRRPIELVATG